MKTIWHWWSRKAFLARICARCFRKVETVPSPVGTKMPKEVRGMADFMEPDFLHAIGVAVTTFAFVESVLIASYFYAKHGGPD
jgi:hypothetical protein